MRSSGSANISGSPSKWPTIRSTTPPMANAWARHWDRTPRQGKATLPMLHLLHHCSEQDRQMIVDRMETRTLIRGRPRTVHSLDGRIGLDHLCHGLRSILRRRSPTRSQSVRRQYGQTSPLGGRRLYGHPRSIAFLPACSTNSHGNGTAQRKGSTFSGRLHRNGPTAYRE